MNDTMLRLLASIVLFCLAAAEYRKLIPLCSNSCFPSGNFQPKNCFCDSKCSLEYNDCCLDAPYRTIRTNTQLKYNISCVFVRGENRHFWMVDTCKDSWSGPEHILEKCMKSSDVSGETNDIIGSVPVTNPVEAITFKNYYCAICNNENTNKLVEWYVRALCVSKDIRQEDLLQNLTFVEDHQQWGVWKSDEEQKWDFNACYLLFQSPANVTGGVRPCVGEMVSTCPKSYKNMAIRRKCKSYVDPIKWRRGPVYRNIDCATCHNQTMHGFQCMRDVTSDVSKVMLSRAMSVDLSSMGQWL